MTLTFFSMDEKKVTKKNLAQTITYARLWPTLARGFGRANALM
jgi:hypothetical protein